MEENKRKQYAHLYQTHDRQTPQQAEGGTSQSQKRGKNRQRQVVEKVCRRLAFSFLAMAVVLLLALNYFQVREAKKEAVLEYIRQEKEQRKKLDAQDTEEEKTDTQRVAILEQYDILYSMYPNLVGWIKVEGTPIDYPVMQDRTGGDFYLTHDFEGKEDNKGNPFISADASIDPLDQNVVIFGHNIRDGSQFGDLDYYLKESFYKKHPVISFDTLYEMGDYQVVAVVKTHVKNEDEAGFRYYWFRNYKNREEFQQLLDFVDENSLYDTGEHLSYGDTTIMLSTCEYTVNNGRLVVIAKRI